MPEQLYPEVIDASVLLPKPASDVFLPIGIEGQGSAPGNAIAGIIYSVSRVDSSVTLFGATSPLHTLVKAVLDRGAGPVLAVASSMTAVPTVTERQAAWEKFESDENVRIRLTDSLVQADHTALAASCKNADVIFNKQFCIVGMAAGTTKAALISAVDAIVADPAGARRCVLAAPGIYDENGAQQDGSFTAAVIASEVAKNPDPANDLDVWPLQRVTAIEKGADGLPVFRRKVVSGAAVNDFEELLQAGVTPVQPSRGAVSGVQTTHLRLTFKQDTTYDNLATRIIQDQVFLDVKEYCEIGGFFREPNTELTRNRIKSGVEAILAERRAWVEPILQPDQTVGYNVTVVSSADMRQITVSYEGMIVRGINTIRVSAQLSITV